MDGRVGTALVTLLLPAILLGITIWKFASNPIAILVLITAMMAGAVYLLSYAESF